MRNNDTMWAICSDRHGWYTGTWLTRAAAIKAHCDTRYTREDLTERRTQEEVWKRCRKLGDSVHKIKLTIQKG